MVFAEPYDPPFSRITWPWEVQGNQSHKQGVFETGILEFQVQCATTRSDNLTLHGTDVDSNCENERESQECILLGGCNRGIYTGQTSRGFGIMVTRRGEKGICYRNRVAVIRPVTWIAASPKMVDIRLGSSELHTQKKILQTLFAFAS